MTENVGFVRHCFLCGRTLDFNEFLKYAASPLSGRYEFLFRVWNSKFVKLVCCGCHWLIMEIMEGKVVKISRFHRGEEEVLLENRFSRIRRVWSVEKYDTVLEMVKK